MQLKDETILAIGMLSMAVGILIGRFLHFEYAGFSVTDFCGRNSGWAVPSNESHISNQNAKKVTSSPGWLVG